MTFDPANYDGQGKSSEREDRDVARMLGCVLIYLALIAGLIVACITIIF